MTNIFTNAANYKSEKGATLVGLNMEGPFISMEKKGAQNGEYIHRPDADMFERLQNAANGLIKLCDIAPEVEGAMDCIERISDKVTISGYLDLNYMSHLILFLLWQVCPPHKSLKKIQWIHLELIPSLPGLLNLLFGTINWDLQI